MDNQLVYKLIEELRQQCRFAQFAFQNLRVSVNALDSEKTFFYVHALLHHATTISRFVWPARGDSQARGDRLRTELALPDDSPLRLGEFRRETEQPDERFEDWLSTVEHRSYVDMNIMPAGTIGEFKPDNFHRSLDPEKFRLHLRGEACDLRQLNDEIRKLDGAIQTWLRTHHPW